MKLNQAVLVWREGPPYHEAEGGQGLAKARRAHAHALLPLLQLNTPPPHATTNYWKGHVKILEHCLRLLFKRRLGNSMKFVLLLAELG